MTPAAPSDPLKLNYFVAVDFEIGEAKHDSACAVGLVKVRDGEITDRLYSLIRPPGGKVLFTQIHGITWEMVKDSPTFGELWPEIEAFIAGVDFIAAHNASFDRSVMVTCCKMAAITAELPHFHCTVELARKVWDIHPTKLPNVCRELGISLHRHHDAMADAEACARIVIAAQQGLPAASPRKRS